MPKKNREVSLKKSQNIISKIEKTYNPENKFAERRFAKKIGLAPATYNQIKNGSRVLGLDALLSIEEKTGIPISQLLKLSETENYSAKGGYRWIDCLSYENINHENGFYLKIFQEIMAGKSLEEVKPLLKENGYRSLPFVESYLKKEEANSLSIEEQAIFFVKAAYTAISSKNVRLMIDETNVKEMQNTSLEQDLLQKIKAIHPSFLKVKILINPLHESFNNKKFSIMPAFIGKLCSYYIKTFLSQNLDKRYIGLAGGFSVFNLVNQIFNRDDIFPSPHFHTNYEIVPLYLEPFGEFRSYVAESIVSNLFLTLYTGSMFSNLQSYIMHPFIYQNDKEELITRDIIIEWPNAPCRIWISQCADAETETGPAPFCMSLWNDIQNLSKNIKK